MRVSLVLFVAYMIVLVSCNSEQIQDKSVAKPTVFIPDTNMIPNDEYGKMVRYGRQLMLNTAYLIGPNGIAGQYTGNKMNCTNCHQDAGTKPFSFNLIKSHSNYPQYRQREAKVLSLAERVNNCVMRPHSGKALPLAGKEMIAFLSYLRWINTEAAKVDTFIGSKNISFVFPDRAANPQIGEQLYNKHCQRCHAANGEGEMAADGITYKYPPLWGKHSYPPGSSMHRIIMQAEWLKANMPHDIAKWDKPFFTDEEALDIAAFVNDDRIHYRPNPQNLDYPNPKDKPIDYAIPPFADSFPALQHKFGPYNPIIVYRESLGEKVTP